MNKHKVFTSFSKLLHIIATSGMSVKEVRNWIIQNCESDEIIFLVDVLDDLLAKAKQ